MAPPRGALRVRRRRVERRLAAPAARRAGSAAALLLLAWSAAENLAPSFVLGGCAARTRLAATRLALAAEGAGGGAAAAKGTVAPVVDDSDFDKDDDQVDEASTKPAPAPNAKKNFESLIQSADRFVVKKERVKRAIKPVSLQLEDDLQGLSIEDEVDLTESLEASARRRPKIETDLPGRIKAWAGETLQLITNPTRYQVGYAQIFFGTAGTLILTGIIVITAGGVRLKGQVDEEEQQIEKAKSPFYRRMQLMQFNRDKFLKLSNMGKADTDPNSEGTADFVTSQPLSLYIADRLDKNLPSYFTGAQATPMPGDRVVANKQTAPVIPGVNAEEGKTLECVGAFCPQEAEVPKK